MNMGEQYRVIYGAGRDAKYEQYATFQQACEAAASVIRAGHASQVVIEKREEDGEWATVRVGKDRR